ncbi:MAG: competence protein ComGC [Colwellia sp.]|jgi:competence protein ComGC
MENAPNRIDKKQASTIEFLAVIVIVAVLMKLLLELFFSQQEKITNTAFTGLAQIFTSKINVVHGQWLMDEQPDVVVLSWLNSREKEYINVNQKGWIDNMDSSLACHHIWQQTLAMPLQVVKSAVIAIEIQDTTSKHGRLCRYSIANGQSFEYRSDTGKVKQVN